MSTLFRIVGFQKLAQAMRLHAHDVVDPSIEVGTASEHFDGNDRLFDMVRVAFGPFGDNVIQKMQRLGAFLSVSEFSMRSRWARISLR